MRAEHGHLGRVRKLLQPITVCTPDTKFKVTRVSEMQFTLPEFSENRRVQWKFHVLPETSSLPYDVIMGRDLMRNLAMDVLYSEGVIVWDELRLPMR